MIKVYGIPNCDTVKKARVFLTDSGKEFHFHNFKKDGLERADVERFLTAVGEALINKRGTTWRKLSDDDKARAESDPAGLLVDYPSIIKRPVIDHGDAITIGFTDDVRERIAS